MRHSPLDGAHYSSEIWCEYRGYVKGTTVTKDIARLERELDELREAILDDWLIVTSRSDETVRALQNTLSWRITKPLRLLRAFDLKRRNVGSYSAAKLAAVAIARRFGER